MHATNICSIVELGLLYGSKTMGEKHWTLKIKNKRKAFWPVWEKRMGLSLNFFLDILWFLDKFYTKEKEKILVFGFALLWEIIVSQDISSPFFFSSQLRSEFNLETTWNIKKICITSFKMLFGNTLVIKWVLFIYTWLVC